MSIENANLTHQALSLPISERVLLAQTLWESLGDSDQSTEHQNAEELMKQIKQRDAELSSGAADARSHQEVMQAARKAIQCD